MSLNIKISESMSPNVCPDWFQNCLWDFVWFILKTIFLTTTWSYPNNLIGSKATSFGKLRLAGIVIDLCQWYLLWMSDISQTLFLRSFGKLLLALIAINVRKHYLQWMSDISWRLWGFVKLFCGDWGFWNPQKCGNLETLQPNDILNTIFIHVMNICVFKTLGYLNIYSISTQTTKDKATCLNKCSCCTNKMSTILHVPFTFFL